MKNFFLVVVVVALAAVPGRAQDSSSKSASGSYGQSKEHQSSESSQAEVGERAPGDASSSTSAEGRPRAGIEVGTASATQGGRTDNGTPPGHPSASDRSARGADQASTANNSANRTERQGETEDQEFNRIPGQGA